jgi:tetratricopeptide (TPR) repeat protein
MLVAEKGYDDTLSDYEKEKLFGNELGKDLITNAVDNCVIYHQSLIQFKKYYAEKAKQDMDSDDKIETDKFINNMQSQLDEINISRINNLQTKKQISTYYVLLGLLYECADREAPAIEQYDKAILIDPENSNAVAFKKLLVKYKNN